MLQSEAFFFFFQWFFLFLRRAKQTVGASGGLFPRGSSAASLEYLRQHEGFTSGWAVMRCDVRLAPPDRSLTPSPTASSPHPFFAASLVSVVGFSDGGPASVVLRYQHTHTHTPSLTLRGFRTAAKIREHVRTLRSFWNQTFFFFLLSVCFLSISSCNFFSSAHLICRKQLFGTDILFTLIFGIQAVKYALLKTCIAAVNKIESGNHLLCFPYLDYLVSSLFCFPPHSLLFIIVSSPPSALPPLTSSSPLITILPLYSHSPTGFLSWRHFSSRSNFFRMLDSLSPSSRIFPPRNWQTHTVYTPIYSLFFRLSWLLQ